MSHVVDAAIHVMTRLQLSVSSFGGDPLVVMGLYPCPLLALPLIVKRNPSCTSVHLLVLPFRHFLDDVLFNLRGLRVSRHLALLCTSRTTFAHDAYMHDL